MTEILAGLRLPAWLLPVDWPHSAKVPQLARLRVQGGRFTALEVDDGRIPAHHQAGGCLALPPLIEAHSHLDKAFTRARIGPIDPGLLAAIEATGRDRQHWHRADLLARGERALEQAWAAGVRRLRSHVDWWSTTAPPAWKALDELRQRWRGRIRLERVALPPLSLFAAPHDAAAIARAVAASEEALLGGFVHTSNFDPQALTHLVEAADAHALDLDLHVDEELDPKACGLERLARLAIETGFGGRITVGHACALATQPEARAAATLDQVAAAGITLVCLPTTNLLLQDALSGRTPRARGLTLVKEARARGIGVLIASDNVQDAFFPYGRQDPLAAFELATITAQLEQPFDDASQALCRDDWLVGTRCAQPSLIGANAELLLFDTTDAGGWPNGATRHVLRLDAPTPSPRSQA